MSHIMVQYEEGTLGRQSNVRRAKQGPLCPAKSNAHTPSNRDREGDAGILAAEERREAMAQT